MSDFDTKGIEMFFDRQASTWDKHDGHDENKIHSLLDRIGIKEGDKILDLGCGTGVISMDLYNLSKTKVIALDLSDEMIKIAKKKYPQQDKIEFKKADFYSFDERGFDYIVVFDAYPHFLQLKEFKKSLLRNLNDNGRFCILHDLGRKQLADCHKGKDVSLLSRELQDPIKEAEFYKDDFEILIQEEGEDFYILMGEKKNVSKDLYAVSEEKRDKRVSKVRHLLIESMFQLLKDKNYNDINPLDLIKSAGISSSTFYANYRTRDYVLECFIDDILGHVLSNKLKKENNHDFSSESDPESLLCHLFLHLEENKEKINLLFDKGGKEIFVSYFKKGITPLMDSFIDCSIIYKEGMEHSFLCVVLTDTLLCFILNWLDSKNNLSADEASSQFLRLFRS